MLAHEEQPESSHDEQSIAQQEDRAAGGRARQRGAAADHPAAGRLLLGCPRRRQQFGPFESYELAQADRDAVGDEALAPGDTLQEAEREVGIADWIDAETGAAGRGPVAAASARGLKVARALKAPPNLARARGSSAGWL